MAFADRAARRDGDLVEQSDAGGVVVETRSHHGHGDTLFDARSFGNRAHWLPVRDW